jgi:hypothetical protein
VNPAGSRAQLTALSRDLANRWAETKAQWRDAKCGEFETRYLQPLETQMTAALTAIEKLESLLQRVRRDCE